MKPVQPHSISSMWMKHSKLYISNLKGSKVRTLIWSAMANVMSCILIILLSTVSKPNMKLHLHQHHTNHENELFMKILSYLTVSSHTQTKTSTIRANLFPRNFLYSLYSYFSVVVWEADPLLWALPSSYSSTVTLHQTAVLDPIWILFISIRAWSLPILNHSLSKAMFL